MNSVWEEFRMINGIEIPCLITQREVLSAAAFNGVQPQHDLPPQHWDQDTSTNTLPAQRPGPPREPLPPLNFDFNFQNQRSPSEADSTPDLQTNVSSSKEESNMKQTSND